MLREQLPNLFRLYLNPYVAQACLCLDRYVRTTWPSSGGGGSRADERSRPSSPTASTRRSAGRSSSPGTAAAAAGRPTAGWSSTRRAAWARSQGFDVAGGGRVEFVPGLRCDGRSGGRCRREPTGLRRPADRFAADVGCSWPETRRPEAQRLTARRPKARRRPCAPTVPPAAVIACVDRDEPGRPCGCRRGLRRRAGARHRRLRRSFVDRDVPFGAFTARQGALRPLEPAGQDDLPLDDLSSPTPFPACTSCAAWSRPTRSSTSAVAADLRRIETTSRFRAELFRRLYSPSLYQGHPARPVRDGRRPGRRRLRHRSTVDGLRRRQRRRLQHPRPQPAELRPRDDGAAAVPQSGRGRVAGASRELTGLAVPAARRQRGHRRRERPEARPRRPVSAAARPGPQVRLRRQDPLRLTGTWNASYKEHIDPLYADVSYVDPFAPDATAQIEAALDGASGRRRAGGIDPGRRRRAARAGSGAALSRRGPAALGLPAARRRGADGHVSHRPVHAVAGDRPDAGPAGRRQGLSDMMFPFALISTRRGGAPRSCDAVGLGPGRRRSAGATATSTDTGRCSNVLRHGRRAASWPARVAESGATVRPPARKGPGRCKAVREVRVFGLLIGIELDATRWPRRWFRKRLFRFYLLGMLRHRRFPVLVGFCQYEPNVLKITPPLTTEPEAVARRRARRSSRCCGGPSTAAGPRVAAGVHPVQADYAPQETRKHGVRSRHAAHEPAAR